MAQYSTDVHNLEGDQWDNLNPLQWWASSAMHYPHLSQLATKYLAPLATSVPSEQAFSTAGNIVNINDCVFYQIMYGIFCSQFTVTDTV